MINIAARERFFYDVRQYALLSNEYNEILVLQLPEHCGDAAHQWTLPGGKLEPGDTPESGLLREIEEETGAEVSALKLMNACRWGTKNSEKLALFYTAKAKTQKLLLSSEHKASKWLKPEEVDDLEFYREEVADVIRNYWTE